ncbi:MAG TPA: universal stress protein [Acidimicrobiales bacterium]
MSDAGLIVVGIDGSSPSREALRWALDEARMREGARVEAVHFWHYPTMTYMPGIAPTPVFAKADLEAEGRAVLDEAVDAVLGEVGANVPLERVVAEGGAVAGLVERSAGADLLVLGHRGHGGFRELLLGSVANQCASHARCPVVIVRPPAEEAS